MTIPVLNPEGGFRRLQINFSYDGTDFQGWAKQPNYRTIQGVLEELIGKIVRAKVDCVTAGRTDAGVHATGAVLHVDIPEQELDIANFAFKLNRILEEDIRITSVREAPEGFHARYSAIARHYEYKIADGDRPISPLERHFVADWYRPLDLELLRASSHSLLGTHDFAAFCKWRENATTIRTLKDFSWNRDESGLLIAHICADGFGYNMVRNLVGAAVCVGEKRYDLDWIRRVLTEKSRVSDSYVFPSRGLTLVKVDYPDDAQLPAIAKEAWESRLTGEDELE
ncbi:MAG: tRNA pseudouridine(38-40) synthase TruA [Actinomycetes bacterium]